MNNQLDLSKSIRRYQVNLYPKDDFNLGGQQLFRAKNKYQLKCQLMEQGLLGRLKEIFVYIKKMERFKQLKTVFPKK